MHVQLVTYRVADVEEGDFIEANREFAEAMATVPGLLAKIWLKQPGEDVHGGLYLWRDREAYQAFIEGELWAEALKDESMLDVMSMDFATMHELTKITQPGLKLV